MGIGDMPIEENLKERKPLDSLPAADVIEWLQERAANCRRLAVLSKSKDVEGWLDDARYFDNAIALLSNPSTSQPVADGRGAGSLREDTVVFKYEGLEAIIHACGLLDVVKQEWDGMWTDHDQAVRDGLSRILSTSLYAKETEQTKVADGGGLPPRPFKLPDSEMLAKQKRIEESMGITLEQAARTWAWNEWNNRASEIGREFPDDMAHRTAMSLGEDLYLTLRQLASSQEALRIATAEKHHALNLLAVMHCDGGHYVGKHGFEKACKDAEELRHSMLNELDALHERMQQAVEKLRRCHYSSKMWTDIDEAIKLLSPEGSSR